MLLAFLAGILSDSHRVSVALLEIAVGVIAGNFMGFHINDRINFP